MKEGTSSQGQEEHQMGSAVLQGCGMKKKSAKPMLQSADREWGASKVTEKLQKVVGGGGGGFRGE